MRRTPASKTSMVETLFDFTMHFVTLASELVKRHIIFRIHLMHYAGAIVIITASEEDVLYRCRCCCDGETFPPDPWRFGSGACCPYAWITNCVRRTEAPHSQDSWLERTGITDSDEVQNFLLPRGTWLHYQFTNWCDALLRRHSLPHRTVSDLVERSNLEERVVQTQSRFVRN